MYIDQPTNPVAAGSYAGADIVVAPSGGDFADIQAGLDAVDTGGGTVYVGEGTYTITSTLEIKRSQTRLILSGGAIVQCNGANVTTLIKPTSTSLSRITIQGGKWLQTNATAQGVAFDFSDCPNCVIAPTRIEEFGTAFVVADTTSTSFYSHFLDTQVFNCNNGIAIGGTQANMNLWENIRIRPKAGGAGIGISLVDTRGNTFLNCDAEPATGTGITGINIDATSRDNSFIGCWVENNATGVNIASGATRNSFIGGSITSNSTADIVDAGTGTVFLNVNETGKFLNKTGPGQVRSVTSYGSGPQTLNTNQHVVNATAGTFTINLPTAVGITGREYVIKNSGSGTVTVDANSTQTIDGAETVALAQYDAITVVSDGTNWFRID